MLPSLLINEKFKKKKPNIYSWLKFDLLCIQLWLLLYASLTWHLQRKQVNLFICS